ncbi:hypothetical protein Pyn_09525 [Prunus yedoensis var. nudiflora]|uniref:Uncharacterized protein n=1 Tax=Prunus yedoensis var. nudiflora TaxID=2094558 RepID=A0A314Y1Y0_PRUYE|nr:hypothetical protein Pyn_09525 [Prunus yedoensis var. nudiflora]
MAVIIRLLSHRARQGTIQKSITMVKEKVRRKQMVSRGMKLAFMCWGLDHLRKDKCLGFKEILLQC